MGKRFETKRTILEMLSARQGTMTEISRVLGLSHSTVSQHLKELEAAGEIEMMQNPHFRKLKYYSIRNAALEAQVRSLQAQVAAV